MGEVWGLAVSPNSNQFATCGGDKTIRIWGVDKMYTAKIIRHDLRAIDWSNNGLFIVVGTVNGQIISYNPKSLEKLDTYQSSFKKPKQWIEDIKISPDNSMVAFGAHGGVSPIEVLSISETGKEMRAKVNSVTIYFIILLVHYKWRSN